MHQENIYPKKVRENKVNSSPGIASMTVVIILGTLSLVWLANLNASFATNLDQLTLHEIQMHMQNRAKTCANLAFAEILKNNFSAAGSNVFQTEDTECTACKLNDHAWIIQAKENNTQVRQKMEIFADKNGTSQMRSKPVPVTTTPDDCKLSAG